MAEGFKNASYSLISLYLLVTIVGLVGNLLSVLVFSHPKMRRSSINILLASMSVSDLILLSTGLPGMCIVPLMYTANNTQASILEAYVAVSSYPISLTAQTCSTWILVIVTIERFLAVCKPLTARRLCTTKKSKIAVAIVVILAVAYNIVRFFEYRIVYKDDGSPEAEELLTANSIYVTWYLGILYYVFIFLIPFCLLVGMNAYVIHCLRKAREERGNMTAQQLTEQRTTVMMIVVIVMFLSCNLLPTVIGFVQTYRQNIFRTYQEIMMLVLDVSNLLYVLNCALNAFVYHYFSDRYRKITKEISYCRYSSAKPSLGSMAVTYYTQKTSNTRATSKLLGSNTNLCHGSHTNLSTNDINDEASSFLHNHR